MKHLSGLKGALASTFGAAADTYHSAADVQREVAARLARRIADIPRAPRSRVLEIGCGTGFLAQALAADLFDATWVMSDLSEAMVKRARANLGERSAQFAVMDGERPAFADGSFDLICASLAFQWFEHLPSSLAGLSNLLAPGGALAFSTLTAESFPEWRAAHREIGTRAATRAYPTAADLEQMVPGGMRLTLETETIARNYRNAHAFLAHWKEIGAHLPEFGRPPLTPGTMRKVLRRFDAGMTVTYQVAYAIMIRN